MKKSWKEHWIIFDYKRKCLQLQNGWHRWSDQEIHLFSIFKKRRRDGDEYYFGLLGFTFRFFSYGKNK